MELKIISVSEIEPNPFQSREKFEKESLKQLSDSIKQTGTLQPIIVRKHGNGYQIVAGERRWRASKMAGLKQIPAIVRTISEENVLIESLIENLHRVDLTDIERENVIYQLWVSKKFNTKSELAHALGIRESIVQDDIEAWEFRNKNKEISHSVPTYVIARTSGLKEEERKKIIKKFEEGEFRAIDVYSAVKIVKKASKPLREEILKPKSSVTPKIAELLVERLPSPAEQTAFVNEIKRHRLTAKEVEDLLNYTGRRKENANNRSDKIVSEIDTGYLFTCPVCKHTYKVYHNKPTNTHTFKEMK